MPRKKLELLRSWFAKFGIPGEPRIMLITGPSGSGKSAAIRLIAAEANKRLLEWKAPVPTLWHDFNYTSFPGSAYSSKLDDFFSFITRACRYLPLTEISLPFLATKDFPVVQQRSASKDPSIYQALRSNDSILILDDIPMGANEEQDKQVLEILRRLARESQIPVVVIVTQTTDSNSLHVNPNADCKDKLSRKQLTSGALTARCLVRALDSSGVFTVSFNPVTVPRLVKVMAAVIRAEGIHIPHSTLADIAAGARGDIRCAINGLQMLSTRFTAKAPMSKDVCAMPRQKDDSIEAQGMLPRTSALKHERLVTLIKRDDILSVFHALGRVLYNKRIRTFATSVDQHEKRNVRGDGGLDSNNVSDKSFNLPGDSQAFPAVVDSSANFRKSERFLQIHPSLCRELMSCDPEAVILSSGMSAESTISFIHENFPKLLCDDAIEDAAVAFGYVSDASIVNKNCFGHTHRGSMSRPTLSFLHPSGTGISIESNVIPELASGSIVVRGVLFAPHPSRPAVRQWSIFKGPRIGRVMQAASKNIDEVRAVVAAASYGDFSIGSDIAAAAAETLPMLRSIASSGHEGAMRVPYLPSRWAKMDDDEATTSGLRKPENDKLYAPMPGKTSKCASRDAESHLTRDVLHLNVANRVSYVDTPISLGGIDDDIVSW